MEKNNNSINNNNLCPICSDSTIDTHIMPCGHEICRNCLYQYLFEKKVCPFCRVEIKGIKEDLNFKIWKIGTFTSIKKFIEENN